MTKTELFVFGADASRVERFSREVQSLLRTKGVEMDGPIPLPTTPVEEFPMDLGDDERAQLAGAEIARRLVRVYRGDHVLKEIVTMDIPDRVFLRLNVHPYRGVSKGKHPPYSYDPHWRR